MTLGEISFGISIVGAVPYALQTARGTVHPARASWFVWTCLLALAVWSYRAEGASDSLWFLVGDLFITAVICVLSIWRGRSGWSRLDVCCLSIAAAGIVIWQATSTPLFGLAGVLIADGAALIPTLVKALREPTSESASTFICSSLAALCGFVAVGEWNAVLLFYPAYLFLANFVTAVTIWVGQYHMRRLPELSDISPQ